MINTAARFSVRQRRRHRQTQRIMHHAQTSANSVPPTAQTIIFALPKSPDHHVIPAAQMTPARIVAIVWRVVMLPSVTGLVGGRTRQVHAKYKIHAETGPGTAGAEGRMS